MFEFTSKQAHVYDTNGYDRGVIKVGFGEIADTPYRLLLDGKFYQATGRRGVRGLDGQMTYEMSHVSESGEERLWVDAFCHIIQQD